MDDNTLRTLKQGGYYRLSTGQNCVCIKSHPKDNVYWLEIANDPAFGLIERPFNRYGMLVGMAEKSVGNVVAEETGELFIKNRTSILS